MSLFNKTPKVKAGKTTQTAAATSKQQSPLAAMSSTWKKLNSMDRKQAYTWGAIVLVSIFALLLLGSAASKDNTEDFSDFESRGYDLANMPFSTDEAEEYLLANQYPDMQGAQGMGLYSAAEKEARQEADAEDYEGEDYKDDYDDGDDNVRDNRYGGSSAGSSSGRYYGGSGRGTGTGAKTNVSRLSSANLKSASGSGVGGTFGPRGDFSNFKSQNKGYDKAPVARRGGNNARKALFQAAAGSRAAAGLKDNKLANAKKAMMGGNIDGSKAFMSDSGAVDLSQAKGLDLDTNAPVSSADLSGLDDALSDATSDASDDARKDDKEDAEAEMWRRIKEQAINLIANRLINSMGDMLDDKIAEWKETRAEESMLNLKTQQAIYDEYLKGSENGTEWNFSYGDKLYEAVPANMDADAFADWVKDQDFYKTAASKNHTTAKETARDRVHSNNRNRYGNQNGGYGSEYAAKTAMCVSGNTVYTWNGQTKNCNN